MIVRSFLASAAAVSLLLACSPSQLTGSAPAVGAGVSIAEQVVPASKPVIAAVCPVVQQGLAVLATQARGGALDQVNGYKAIAAASCTEEGQSALAANDAKPKTATNSGDSASWLPTLLSSAAAAVKIGLMVAPLL